MSTSVGATSIIVVGRGELAEAVATEIRRSTVHTLVGSVAPEQTIAERADVVISLAAPAQRVEVAERAIAAGMTVATLPFVSSGERERRLVASGRVAQVSQLLGFAALETLRRDVLGATVGRRYSLFAAHRVRQGTGDVLEMTGVPLLHYVLGVLGEVPERVQVTCGDLFGGQADTWLTILHLTDGTLATVEFAASLSASAPANEQVLVEVNGSDAVLRAEPTRQAILVSTGDGSTRERGWWREPAVGFTPAAIAAANQPDAMWEAGWLKLIDAVRRAGESGVPVVVG